jgi:hypothetical protein
MWSMRLGQLDSFRMAAVQRFEDLMVEHWKEFFPAKCEAMGGPQVRELIRYGIRRAQMYEITEEQDVSVFLDVMLVMGRDFDLCKENAWSLRILRESGGSTSTERVGRLRDATLDRLRLKKEADAGI